MWLQTKDDSYSQRPHEIFRWLTAEVFTRFLYLDDALNRLLRTVNLPSVKTPTTFLGLPAPDLIHYGMTNFNKPNIPWSPIISSTGIFIYNDAFFPIITPITTNPYTTDNITSFAKEIAPITSNNPSQRIFILNHCTHICPYKRPQEFIANTLDTVSLNILGLSKANLKNNNKWICKSQLIQILYLTNPCIAKQMVKPRSPH